MKCYQIYIPTVYNDGTDIEEEKLDSITEKIEKRFNGCSIYPKVKPPIVQGIWIDEKIQERHEDKIVMVEIVVKNTIENNKWFKKLKEELKKSLKQKEIFIITHDVDIL